MPFGFTVRRICTSGWTYLVLLLMVLASRWLLIAARPATGPTLASQALGCAWGAFGCFVLQMGRSPKRPGSSMGIPVLRCLLAGGLLFGGPSIAALLQTPGVPASSTTIALALTPIVAGIVAAALGGRGGQSAAGSLTGQLWPPLAAVAGLLLLLVQPSLTNLRTDVALLLAPILTGIGAALLATMSARQAGQEQRIGALALAGGATVYTLGFLVELGTRTFAHTVSLSAVACDAVVAALSIAVLLRLSAQRWSAQFVLTPLLILLEGLVLSRPALDLRSLVGLGLLALGGGYLLMPPSPDEEPSVIPGR